MLDQFVKTLFRRKTNEISRNGLKRRASNSVNTILSVILMGLLSHYTLATENGEPDFGFEFDVNQNEFNPSLYYIGASVFENVIFKIDSNLLDTTAKKQRRHDECFGLISSCSSPLMLSKCNENTLVKLSQEDLDILNEEMLEEADFPNNFRIENIEIGLKGQGVYPNGYWFKAKDPEYYDEDYKESDLPFISFETLKDIVEGNKILLMRRSMIDSRFNVNSIKTTLRKDRFHIEGFIEVRSYINGHSMIELEHRMSFDLKKK